LDDIEIELSELSQGMAIAAQAARTAALLDAEKVVRDMIDGTRWASEANLLKRAADRIAALS